MSSQAPDPEDAGENTPLLRPTPPECRPGEHADGGEQEAVQGSQDALQRTHARLVRYRNYIRMACWTELVATIMVAAFVGVTAVMLSYGSYWFNVSNYTVGQACLSLAVICFFAVCGTAGNLLRIRNSNVPFPSLINILIYGVLCLSLFVNVMDIINDWYMRLPPDSPMFCRRIDWDEPSYFTPIGTWEGCLAWEASYIGVVITLLALMVVNGLISLGLMALSFIEVFLQRPPTGGIQQVQQRGSWIIPVGHVSVEVSLRWGPPGRVSEENRIEGNPPTSNPDREPAGDRDPGASL